MLAADLLPRDSNGVLHVVALSGGKDSTAMALGLQEREPDVPRVYVCTPTGDELPEMFLHWRKLADLLGQPLIPIVGGTLKSICADEGALPNWRMRFCTRRLKIEPFQAFILRNLPAVSYVGLRADEGAEDREGARYAPAWDVKQRWPLREWGWGLADVLGYLERQGVEIPRRTDCARCFFQTLGEWYLLWAEHPAAYADAERQEEEFGHTFRSPGRDTWPAALSDLRREFEGGRTPRGVGPDAIRAATCRVCSL